MNITTPSGTGPHKIILSLIFAIAFFSGGVVVGRSDFQIGRDTSQNSKLPSGLDYTSVDGVYNLLKQDFDGNLNTGQLLDGAKGGLVNAAGDPYTEYFSPKDAKSFNDELSGNFTGIGAELGGDSSNDIVIVSPLSGSPAEKAGLKPHDIISAVNGQSVQGMTVDAVVSKIRGPENTKVTLTIIRATGSPFDVIITRANITIPSVTSSVDGDIGYLKISQFTSDMPDLAKKAAADFKAKNVKGVVLDLRGDPGGYLSGAVSLSSLWLDKGQTVVAEKRGATVVSTEYASGNNTLHGLPTVVLIGSGSASASEITAGALHDNKDATLVGVKSFGKGSVQEIKDLSDGGELKITIARWYTPAGKNIDKQGITPDTSVTISDDDIKAGHDPQKDKAYQLLQSEL